jgi:hypothetical protein
MKNPNRKSSRRVITDAANLVLAVSVALNLGGCGESQQPTSPEFNAHGVNMEVIATVSSSQLEILDTLEGLDSNEWTMRPYSFDSREFLSKRPTSVESGFEATNYIEVNGHDKIDERKVSVGVFYKDKKMVVSTNAYTKGPYNGWCDNGDGTAESCELSVRTDVTLLAEESDYTKVDTLDELAKIVRKGIEGYADNATSVSTETSYLNEAGTQGFMSFISEGGEDSGWSRGGETDLASALDNLHSIRDRLDVTTW